MRPPDPARSPAGGPVIAFGPEMPGWGSWDWVGADVRDLLAPWYRTLTFAGDAVPPCDACVVVKHPLPPGRLGEVARRAAVIYCPVDYYGSAAAIDADGPSLRRCARVVVHAERLRRYFAPYAPVEYLDHHLKFAAPLREPGEGGAVGEEFLWVGVRSNLPALAAWANARPLPGPLRVLTNPEDPLRLPSPAELGFRRGLDVRVEVWSPERQVARTAECRAALDVKGEDFRSRHKPPAKALDFLASGVPLALNAGSAPAEHLARMGFEPPAPEDLDHWLSPEYAAEVRRFGAALRELLSPGRVARRWRRLIDEVLAARR